MNENFSLNMLSYHFTFCLLLSTHFREHYSLNLRFECFRRGPDICIFIPLTLSCDLAHGLSVASHSRAAPSLVTDLPSLFYKTLPLTAKKQAMTKSQCRLRKDEGFEWLWSFSSWANESLQN